MQSGRRRVIAVETPTGCRLHLLSAADKTPIISCPVGALTMITGHDHSFGQTSGYVILNCMVKYYIYEVMFYAICNTKYGISHTQYVIDSTGRWRVRTPFDLTPMGDLRPNGKSGDRRRREVSASLCTL